MGVAPAACSLFSGSLVVTSFTEARKHPKSDFTSFANHQKKTTREEMMKKDVGLYRLSLRWRDIRIQHLPCVPLVLLVALSEAFISAPAPCDIFPPAKADTPCSFGRHLESQIAG